MSEGALAVFLAQANVVSVDGKAGSRRAEQAGTAFLQTNGCAGCNGMSDTFVAGHAATEGVAFFVLFAVGFGQTNFVDALEGFTLESLGTLGRQSLVATST